MTLHSGISTVDRGRLSCLIEVEVEAEVEVEVETNEMEVCVDIKHKVIGLDIGHSSVKISAMTEHGSNVRMLFPSVVCQAFHISDDVEQRRAAVETVEVEQRRYFFGETAKTQGGQSVTRGLSEDWITTHEHTALLLGALRKLESQGVATEKPILVLGLPTHLFSRQRDALKSLVGTHVDAADIKVVPQPLGPYQCFMLGEDGRPKSERIMTRESWGVVEVGHFTTDFMLLQKGRWVEKASGVCSGVSVAAGHLVRLLAEKSITVNIVEAEDALLTKSIRYFGKKLDATAEVERATEFVVSEVVDSATRLMGQYARNLDGVIVAGGGAGLVFDKIKKRWPHAVVAEDPRYSVAEGMRRLGIAMNLLSV